MSTTMNSITTVASTATTMVNQTAPGAQFTQSQILTSLTTLMGQVKQLHKFVTDEFNLNEAHGVVDTLYKASLECVSQTLRDQQQVTPSKDSNPMPVALELAKIVCSERIQFEDELLYKISKTCRLFTECFVTRAIQSKHPIIYKETSDKFINSFDKILGVVPDHQLGTRYELQCARATARLVSTDESLLEKYKLKAIDAIADYKGSSPAKLGLHLAIDGAIFINTYRKEHPWVYKVLDLSWGSHALLHSLPGGNLEEFYKNIPDEMHHRMAFCVVETLAKLCQQKNEASFIKGEAGKPGLLAFVDMQAKSTQKVFTLIENALKKLRKSLEKSNSAEKIPTELPQIKKLRLIDPFWKVRYRAIEHLDFVFKATNLDHQKEIVFKIARRLPCERDPLVSSQMEDLRRKWTNNSDLQSTLKEGIEKGKEDLKNGIQSKKAKKSELEKKRSSSSNSSNTVSTLQSARSEYEEEKPSAPTLSEQEKEELEWEIQLLDMTLEIEEQQFKTYSEMQ